MDIKEKIGNIARNSINGAKKAAGAIGGGADKLKKSLSSGSSHSAVSKAVKEDELSRKTTIRARIIRLSLISVLVTVICLTAVNLISMYNQVVGSANDELKMLTLSYASALSNADITENKDFLNSVFVDFKDNNEYNGFGFAVTKQGSVFSETGSDIIIKGDDFKVLAESDTDYTELNAIVTAFDGTTQQQVIKFKGEKYFIGWSQLESFDSCYVMMFFPASVIMKPYYINIAIVLALATFFITASIIISLRVANLITEPIIAAAERLTALSGGDLASPAPSTRRNDETYILLKALNDTILAMRSYIDDIKSVLSSVADGNLMITSNANYSGDFEAIKISLERILSSLNGTFKEVSRAAVSVKECSVNVSEGTNVLSRNTASEAGTMEELTASLSEVSAKINSNAKEAAQAQEMARSADSHAATGSNNMNHMIEAIEEIETSAVEIEKIINVIDDIAFQTNILALNAAVEAARAGDAGKGFAVVADEVRNLANKSAEAAAQTSTLIENTVQSVRKGTVLADETRKSLDVVVEMVASVTNVVEKIAVSTNEQANAVSQINDGMELINGTIQDNSVAAERNANVSEELSGQFDVLNTLINKFQFRK